MADRLLPSKLALALFGYALLIGRMLAGALMGPVMDVIGMIAFVVRVPVLIGFVVLVFSSGLAPFLVALCFEGLNEGDWRVNAAGAYGGSLVVRFVLALFETRFSAGLAGYRDILLSFVSPESVLLGLAASLLGAWLAFDNLWRPNVQRVREMLFSFLILPSD